MEGNGSARRVFMGRGGERTREAVRTMKCGARKESGELARGTRTRDEVRAHRRAQEEQNERARAQHTRRGAARRDATRDSQDEELRIGLRGEDWIGLRIERRARCCRRRRRCAAL